MKKITIFIKYSKSVQENYIRKDDIYFFYKSNYIISITRGGCILRILVKDSSNRDGCLLEQIINPLIIIIVGFWLCPIGDTGRRILPQDML